MQQLSPQDSQFLYMETQNNLGHATAVNIYDPASAQGKKVNFDGVLRHIEGRLSVSPVFSRRLQSVPLDLDFPYWVNDEYFDFESHVTQSSLYQSADWRQFCQLVGRFHSRPINMQRPLWEIQVVEGLGNIDGFAPNSFAILTKIHHCAIDGTSGMKLLSALWDVDAKGTPLVPVSDQTESAGKSPGLRTMLTNAVVSHIRSPLRVADTVWKMCPTLYPALKNRMLGGQANQLNVPATRFNQRTSPHKVFDAIEFNLEDLKAIRQRVDKATINDVVLAICSAGLRRYLHHHGELPQESLVAWAPINARPRNTMDERSGAREKIETAGNNITAMTVNLHTTVDDPIERLRLISLFTRHSKAGKAGIPARVMTDITKHIPGVTLAMASRLLLKTGLAGKLCNVFISNVPGPQMPLYMNGAKCVHNFGLAPLGDGMGLFIATPSYNGQMAFCVTSTREILPDIEFFLACLKESFSELMQKIELQKVDKISNEQIEVKHIDDELETSSEQGSTV